MKGPVPLDRWKALQQTALPSYTAQVRDPARDQAYVGAWLMGPSAYCIDDRTVAYEVLVSNAETPDD